MSQITLARRFGNAAGLGAGGALLCALYFLYYGSGAAWSPFFSVYLRQLGLSGVEIGLINGLRPVAMFLSQPLWGVAADTWGRRRVLLVGMLLAVLLLPGYALSRAFTFFIAWTLLYNTLSNPVGALIDSLVLDHLEGRQELSFGRLRVWGAIGWGASAPLVGYAITGRDTRLIFGIAALFMFVGWLLVLRTSRGDSGARPVRQSWSGLGRLLRNRQLLGFLLLITLLQTGAASIFSFLSVYLSELGASSRLIGFAFSLQGIGELPLYLSSAAILRWIGPKKTLIFAFLVFALRTLLYSIISRPEIAILVELSHGLSFSLFLVASVDYVDRIVPSAWRATGQSLFWAAYFGAGSIAGNAWAGFLYDRVGVQQMFRYNGYFILAAAVAAIVIVREGLPARPTTPGAAQD